MKKFTVLSLISILVLAFGATVYGQGPTLEFKASGWIDMINELKINVPEAGSGDSANDQFYGPAVAAAYRPNGASYDHYEAWTRSRGRLKFDAIMGKEMMGTFQFEFDAINWGSTSGDRNRLGYFGADRAGLEVKHMYITFGMPWVPIPLTIQAGIQPIAVRPRVNLYNDGPGITVAAKIDPALIKFLWFKMWEGSNTAGDDSDIYGIDANAKISTFTLGAYALYYNMNTYRGVIAGVEQPTPSYRADMWWAGLYAEGKAGPINLTFDFGYDDGKVEDRRDNFNARSVDYQGWMARLELAYPWEKFTFGTVLNYGSGSDANDTSVSGLPGTLADDGSASKKVGAYAFAPLSEGGPGDLVVVNAHPDFDRGLTGYYIAGTQMTRNPYGGIWYAKLYAAMNVTDMWKVTLAGAWIGDTTDNGNTIGNARGSDGRLKDDNEIGIEFDLLNQIVLYKNLTFDLGIGYLIPDDAVDFNVTGTENDSPKNPFAITSRLTYSF
jgi:hypothetical protein